MAVSAQLAAFAGAVVLVVGLCFLYVFQGTALRDLTAQSELAREALVGVEEVNRTLEFRIEQTFSLERISRIARGRLGMVEPSIIRYVPLPTSES